MASKQLHFDVEARQALLAGVEKLAKAVKSTLGPRGRNAVLDKSWGGPTVTKDGVTVAEEVELRDKAENMGALLVKEAAAKTSDKAGDGTTTATVLAHAMVKEGLRNVAAGANAISLKRGVDKATAYLVEEIASQARPVEDSSAISQVGTISAGNDEEVGTMIAEAMDKVGREGVISLEEGKSMTTELEVTEGMRFML